MDARAISQSKDKGWSCYVQMALAVRPCVRCVVGREGFTEAATLELTQHDAMGLCQVHGQRESQREFHAEERTRAKHEQSVTLSRTELLNH